MLIEKFQIYVKINDSESAIFEYSASCKDKLDFCVIMATDSPLMVGAHMNNWCPQFIVSFFFTMGDHTTGIVL